MEGVEPSHTVPETAVLPLDDTPMSCALLSHRFLGGVTLCQGANQYITDRGTLRQPPFLKKFSRFCEQFTKPQVNTVLVGLL